MYNAEFHIHPQVDGKYDLDENDAIIFSKEADHVYDVKRLDDLWDVIEEHPELDDLTFMVEAFITDEDNEVVEAEVVEDNVEAAEAEDEVIEESEVDEADEGNKYLEDWKFVVFADVLRIIDTPIDSDPDINQIYRDGSTLSVMAYEEGELPNLNGMVSELGPEQRVCSFDDNGHLVVGPALTVDDEENVAPNDESDDSDDTDDSDNEDTDDNDSGNVSVGEDGKIELEP